MLDIVIICILAILLVIFLGYITKTNIGLWAMTSAYLLGVFVLGIKPSDIITLWPIKIFLMLFSVTLFYGYPALNGTLEKLSMKVVYASRKIPWSIAIVLFIIAIVLSGIGAGDGVTVMLIPIAISIAKISGMNYFLAAVSVVTGISIGGFSPISGIGIFIRELADHVGGYGPDAVNGYANRALFQSFVMFSVVFILSYFIFKGYKVKSPVLEKPEPYNDKQIKTLGLISMFVGILLFAPLLKTVFPTVPFFTKLHGKIYLTFIAFICSIIARLLKLGDEKEVFERVPWPVLTTICGMGMLIAVVGKSGVIDSMSAYLADGSLPGILVQILLAVFSGIMSLFVSGFVVLPTFFTIVPGLATGLAMSPGLLFAAIALGTGCTAVSPFSGMGGLVVASVDDEKKRNKIFNGLLVWPFINLLIYIVLIFMGI